MSVESVEAAAAPLIGDAVKALEPEADTLLRRFDAYAQSERAKLIEAVAGLLNEHQAGLGSWLESELGNVSAAWNKAHFTDPAPTTASQPGPTPARPAAPTPAA